LFHGIPVQGSAFCQAHTAFDIAFGDPLHTADCPFFQNWALFDLDGEDEPAVQISLLHENVIELAGAEEGSYGTLNVPVIHWLSDDDTGAADDLRGSEPAVPLYDYTVDRWRGWLLSPKNRRDSKKEDAGGQKLKGTAHQ